MKKILKGMFIFIITMIATISFVSNVDAASATISVTSNKKQVLVGNEFNVTVKISSSENLGAWDYTLKYDSSEVRLISGNSREAEDAGKNGVKNYSYNYKFKALKSSKTSISVKSYSVIDWASGSEMSMSSVGTASVKIMTQKELEATYSTNNYLSSLSINGYELEPVFNKEINEYKVIFPSEIEQIEVIAKKADSNASVTGDGIIAVSEGDNAISIVVTSQKGTTRTYNITATVVDQNPIVVKIDNKDYSIVKRASILVCPTTYVETTTKINDIDVPSFYSDITKYTLVGLKNDKNEVNLYVHDEKNNTYVLYKEMSFAKLLLFPTQMNDVPENYKEFQIKINNELVTVYKINKESKFALLYGTNIETGKKSLYMYDSEENTLQRYNEDELSIYKKDVKDFMIISFIFGTCLFITITVFICYAKKNNKIKNKLLGVKKIKNDNSESKDESIIKDDSKEKVEPKSKKSKKEKNSNKKEIDADFKI